MKRILFLILMFVGVSSFAFSQAVETKGKEKEITICPVEFTRTGRTANFRFNYIYLVETSESGSVIKVKQINKENPKFIKDEKFVSCIEGWKLNPSEKYSVSIYVGTSSQYKDYISISNKTETIKIYLIADEN